MDKKLQECYCEARQEDDWRRSIVQQILQKSTEFLRRITVVSGETGRGYTVMRVPPLPPISA